jgi:hypothetical protein
MNATVCGDKDQGEDGRFKIAGSDKRRGAREEEKGGSIREKEF